MQIFNIFKLKNEVYHNIIVLLNEDSELKKKKTLI